MKEGNVGWEIGIPWIPATPGKKAIPLRAGAKPTVVKLEDGLGSGSELEEVEEYPPGFEPKVRYMEPALLSDVHVNVAVSMRRGNSGFEADDFGGVEGYDAIPIEMGPFSRLLAMADANRLVERYGSTCGHYAGPISCLCMNCGMEHLGSSSSINHQNWCFPWVYSADSGCRGIGGLSAAQSQFCEITRPWNSVDANNKETGPPLTPVTPDKARGLQSRNSEAESLSACDRTNSERYSHENDVSAQGSSEEPLKDSPCSTITKASTESQVIDKGDTLGIELNTPQKKERRGKHRPKVVKEGKSGRPSSRKRTADKTGVSSDTPKPKRKYVQRKGIENSQTGSQEGQGDSTNQETVKSEPVKKSRGRKPKVNVHGGTNPNPSEENRVRKRKYVRKKKGVGNDNATSLAKVPSNLTDSTIFYNITSRKSCRRGLNFGWEGLTGEGNDDQTIRIPAERNNDCRNNDAGCSPFPRRKGQGHNVFPQPLPTK